MALIDTLPTPLLSLINETARWCLPRLDPSNLATCWRREASRPKYFEPSRAATVASLVRDRPNRLGPVGIRKAGQAATRTQPTPSYGWRIYRSTISSRSSRNGMPRDNHPMKAASFPFTLAHAKSSRRRARLRQRASIRSLREMGIRAV